MTTHNQFVGFQEKIHILQGLHRTGWVMRGVPNPETVASHSWRVALMAIQKESDLKTMNVDINRIIEMCLLHDVAESVVGDIVPEHEQQGQKISKAEKKLLEMNAIDDFSEQYDFPKLKTLFNEYENQETIESQIVKNLDKIDMLLQAYEYLENNPELTDLNKFMEFNEKDVNLAICSDDLIEIKSRQYQKKTTPNNFIDTQTIAGKIKHIRLNEKTSTTIGEVSFQTAVGILHMEHVLIGKGLNVSELIRMAVIYNMAKYVLNNPAMLSDIERHVFKQSHFIQDLYENVNRKNTPEAILITKLEAIERTHKFYNFIKEY